MSKILLKPSTNIGYVLRHIGESCLPMTRYVAGAGLELAWSSDWPLAHASHVLVWCLEWSDKGVNTGPKTYFELVTAQSLSETMKGEKKVEMSSGKQGEKNSFVCLFCSWLFFLLRNT